MKSLCFLLAYLIVLSNCDLTMSIPGGYNNKCPEKLSYPDPKSDCGIGQLCIAAKLSGDSVVCDAEHHLETRDSPKHRWEEVEFIGCRLKKYIIVKRKNGNTKNFNFKSMRCTTLKPCFMKRFFATNNDDPESDYKMPSDTRYNCPDNAILEGTKDITKPDWTKVKITTCNENTKQFDVELQKGEVDPNPSKDWTNFQCKTQRCAMCDNPCQNCVKATFIGGGVGCSTFKCNSNFALVNGKKQKSTSFTCFPKNKMSLWKEDTFTEEIPVGSKIECVDEIPCRDLTSDCKVSNLDDRKCGPPSDNKCPDNSVMYYHDSSPNSQRENTKVDKTQCDKEEGKWKLTMGTIDKTVEPEHSKFYCQYNDCVFESLLTACTLESEGCDKEGIVETDPNLGKTLKCKEHYDLRISGPKDGINFANSKVYDKDIVIYCYQAQFKIEHTIIEKAKCSMPLYCIERNELKTDCKGDLDCAEIKMDNFAPLKCEDQIYILTDKDSGMTYSSVECNRELGEWASEDGSGLEGFIDKGTNLVCMPTGSSSSIFSSLLISIITLRSLIVI